MDFNIKNFSKSELLEIYASLNKWEWHDSLGMKPDGYDDMLDFHMNDMYKLPTKSKIIKPYMKEIEKVISDKDHLKYHHTVNLKHTNSEFYIWWYKRKIQKLLRVGFYSRKNRMFMKSLLADLAVEQNLDKSKDIYNKNEKNNI